MENKIIKAIQKINPTAEVSVSEEDINSIVWHNGTPEISKTDIEAQITVVEQELKDAEQAAIDKKASGKQKLKDLGLDDDEIQALIGV